MYTSTPPCCLIASVSLSLSASLHSLQFAVIPLSLSDSPVLNFPSVCSCHSNTRISPLASYHTRKKAIPYFMLFLSISSWSHYNKINNQSNSLNTIIQYIKYKVQSCLWPRTLWLGQPAQGKVIGHIVTGGRIWCTQRQLCGIHPKTHSGKQSSIHLKHLQITVAGKCKTVLWVTIFPFPPAKLRWFFRAPKFQRRHFHLDRRSINRCRTGCGKRLPCKWQQHFYKVLQSHMTCDDLVFIFSSIWMPLSGRIVGRCGHRKILSTQDWRI